MIQVPPPSPPLTSFSQGNFAEKDKKLRLVQDQLESAQKVNLDLRTCISELESRIAQTAGGHSERIEELMALLQEKESSVTALRSEFTQHKVALDAKVRPRCPAVVLWLKGKRGGLRIRR